LTATHRSAHIWAGLVQPCQTASDLPWFNPHYALGCVLFAHIAEDERRAIIRGNALRLLGEQLDKKGNGKK